MLLYFMTLVFFPITSGRWMASVASITVDRGVLN
jgi:hypothetical protein